ncbi:MAG: ATP synthase subunit I [Thalassotalea sp.]
MNSDLVKTGRELARIHLYISLVLTMSITIVMYFVWGLTNATSALAGGFVAIIPNVIFAHKAFKYAGARAAKKVVDSFYSGVKLKMLTTALLFTLAFKFLELSPLTFFLTYFLTLTTPFVQALIHKFTFNQL